MRTETITSPVPTANMGCTEALASFSQTHKVTSTAPRSPQYHWLLGPNLSGYCDDPTGSPALSVILGAQLPWLSPSPLWSPRSSV